MPRLKDGLSFKAVLRSCSVVALHQTVILLLLTHNCAGQSQVIGPLQRVEATVGDDVILPCHLQPASDASTIVFEWTRPDLNPRFVHVWRSGEELLELQNLAYNGRTSLSMEKLKSGDISLKLSKVKPCDEGRYRCFLPALRRESTVELIVKDVIQEPSSSGVPVIVFLAVLCLLLVCSLVFVFWKLRHQKRNNKMHNSKRVEEGAEGRTEEMELLNKEQNRVKDEEMLKEKEEEMTSILCVIMTMMDQQNELMICRDTLMSQLQELEQRIMEIDKELNALFSSKKNLLDNKLQLQRRKSQYDQSLLSTNKMIQTTEELIRTLTERRDKVENQIREMRKQLGTNMEIDEIQPESDQSETDETKAQGDEIQLQSDQSEVKKTNRENDETQNQSERELKTTSTDSVVMIEEHYPQTNELIKDLQQHHSENESIPVEFVETQPFIQSHNQCLSLTVEQETQQQLT